MKTSPDNSRKNRNSFFWVFMIFYSVCLLSSMLLAYIVDNNVFTNDEFPDAMMAGIMIIYCVCSMIVPGIAAHFVYEKAKRSWIIWICPLVLMLISIPLWMIPVHNSARGLVVFPIACGMPLTLLIPHPLSMNVEILTFADIAFWPSVFYLICILFTKWFLQKSKNTSE